MSAANGRTDIGTRITEYSLIAVGVVLVVALAMAIQGQNADAPSSRTPVASDEGSYISPRAAQLQAEDRFDRRYYRPSPMILVPRSPAIDPEAERFSAESPSAAFTG